MLSKLKLHYNEGCINVIANESIYWEAEKFDPLTGKISTVHLPKVPRYIYTGRDASGIILCLSNIK